MAGAAYDSETGEERRIGPEDAGQRLDVYLNRVLDWNSRARIKEAVKLGLIRLNDLEVKPSTKLKEGDRVSVGAEPPPPDDYLPPEDIPLRVLHEDASLLVIDKAPYIAVHPGAGQRTGTLANAFAFHFEELSDVGGPQRPGIVHRLDRDTSGVLAVAKSNRAHYSITGQFHDRTVSKTYLAIVEGVLEFDEYLVERPMGKHPGNPLKMCLRDDGRPSSTRFELIERFDGFSFVRCLPKTGRTHQIRVHLESLGHPIVCDRLYGRRHRISWADLAAVPRGDARDRTLMDRQALHAARLELDHPMTGVRMIFEAPLHEDMQSLLDALRETRRSGHGRSGGR